MITTTAGAAISTVNSSSCYTSNNIRGTMEAKTSL